MSGSADNAWAESCNAACERETLLGRRAFVHKREARLTGFRLRRPAPPLPTRSAIPDHLREPHL